MKRSSYILMAINLIVWGYFVWSGLDDMRSMGAQNFYGYSSKEQFDYYVIFPVIMLVLSLALPIFLHRMRWHRLGMASQIATLLALLPYFPFYTGGM
jgi:hypothetical protein